MANKRIGDLPVVTSYTPGDKLAIDGATTRGITVEDLLTDNLVAIQGLTSAADKGIQFTGAGAASTYDLTAAGKAILDDADAAAQRATLGVVPGTDVQGYDADLAALAANSTNGLWARTGSGTGAARTITGTSGQISVTNGDGVSGNPTAALVDTSVAPGSYVSANITVDAKGRITAASDGVGDGLREWSAEYATYNSFADSGGTVIPFDDTIPQVTEGSEIMTLTFTPLVSTLEVEACAPLGFATNDARGTIAIFKDGSANAIAASLAFIANSFLVATPITVKKRITVTSGVSTTVSVRVGPASGAGTLYINGNSAGRRLGGVMSAWLKVREINAGP